MTDAEVICEFMEPREIVDRNPLGNGKRSDGDWWRRETEWSDSLKWKPWQPASLNLDGLHKVEERLNAAQWSQYASLISFASFGHPDARDKLLLHASASQKITALASVLRKEVERG